MKKKKQMLRMLYLAALAALLAAMLLGHTLLSGCDACADVGEYCTDLDCCGDLVCKFDQTAGYRCR